LPGGSWSGYRPDFLRWTLKNPSFDATIVAVANGRVQVTDLRQPSRDVNGPRTYWAERAVGVI